MRISILQRLFLVCLTLAAALTPAGAQSPVGARVWPEKVGDFQARDAAAGQVLGRLKPEDFEVERAARRSYVGAGGEEFAVAVVKTRTAAAAFSLLRQLAADPAASDLAAGLAPERLGTIPGVGLGLAEPARVRFVKGNAFVDVSAAGDQPSRPEAVRAFARLFADTLDGEPGELPVLILHLPEWERKLREDLRFAVTLPALQAAAGPRPALDVLTFEGGAEAVTATYGSARLVVVEFTTPQHSVDADAAINQRINELKGAGQPVPTLYRREGNYSVFVFDAPEAAAAEQLVAGVKYEKDVRWLGRNPRADEIVARQYTKKMGGVILMSLITTGLAILLCLGVGGVIGGAVFLYRRARTAEQEVYTDAGGMQRLNLMELNTPPAPLKLLERAEE